MKLHTVPPPAEGAADKPSGRPRGSIIWKLFGSVLLCLALLLVFNWLLNNFALSPYYKNVKQDSLEAAFRKLDDAYNGAGEQVEPTLKSLYYDENISTAILRYSILDGYNINYYGWFGGKEGERWMQSALTGAAGYTTGSFEVKVFTDSLSKSQFITLSGMLTNGSPILMRTPMAPIEESVGITNQFLVISGIVTLLVSLVFSLLIARSFTRPIRELSRVADSVAGLNFDVRYTGKGTDELAHLGSSINSMAASLETTISGLKTANARLAGDVQLKTKESEARKAFIANVSHEHKTPISLIQTYAEGLKEDIADGAGNREYYCGVIEDEAQKMSELLKKMTALMQLEAGSEQLVIERFDILELIRGLLSKNSVRFEQKGIRVSLDARPDGPIYVWADDYLMENVLTNYLSNALNHVPDCGRVILRIRPAEEGRVRISVYNTGTHIPPEDLSRIWESFYKVDKARTREYGGTGIGLSVVAAIMKAHGMPYGVYNRQGPEGPGVEFYIELESH